MRLSLFTDDKILCIENLKESTKKLFEQISTFSEAVRSTVFPYASNEQPKHRLKRQFDLQQKQKNKKVGNKYNK